MTTSESAPDPTAGEDGLIHAPRMNPSGPLPFAPPRPATPGADPTAGERNTCGICAGTGQVYDGPRIVWRSCPFCRPATPDADDASTECLPECSEWSGHVCPSSYPDASAEASEPLTEAEREALLSVERDEDAVAVVERIKADAATKARSDERKRIAQAIEADGSWWSTSDQVRALRIARGDA